MSRALVGCLLGVATMGWVPAAADETDTWKNFAYEVGETELVLSHGECRLPVSLLSPRFVFEDGTIVEPAAPTGREGDLEAEGGLELTYSALKINQAESLEARMTLKASPEEGVLRKTVSVRLVGGSSGRILREAVLDSVDMDRAGRADRQTVFLEPQSYPIFFKGFFAGVEYPVASTRIEDSQAVIAHMPGARLEPGQWYECRTAVYGATPAGDEHRRFRDYITSHLPEPPEYRIVYDHWLTTKLVYSEQEMVDLLKLLKTRLYDDGGPGLDFFRIICVWSDPESIWEIDRERLPREFAPFREVAESMECDLGLWISPASCYPFAQNPEWARDHGYETYVTEAEGVGDVVQACMAGERYRSEFKANLLHAVTNNDVKHIQFDGYRFECTASDHGHEPGRLSCEAVADGFLEVVRAVREAVPGIHLHCAYGSNPSPWWLFDLNTTLVHYGADAPYGRVPAPVYFDSYTTARDRAYLQAATYVFTPIAAQDVYGFYDHSPDPMGNDLIMSTLRGHLLSSVIVHPGYRTDDDWAAIRRALNFARDRSGQLVNTEPLLPVSWQGGRVPILNNDPMPREPYGYAHWDEKEALVILRNPWIVPQTYELPLAGRPYTPEGKNLAAVGLFPEPRDYGRKLGDSVKVPLAPYETVVLSIQAEGGSSDLPKAKDVLADPVRAHVTEKELTRVAYEDGDEVFGAGRTSLVGDADGAVALKLSAEVDIAAPRGQLLILIEDSKPPVDPIGRIVVNGVEREAEYSPSEVGWAADVPPRPEHWLFLIVPLDSGPQTIGLDLLDRSRTGTLSVWVLAKKDAPEDAEALPCGLPYPEDMNLGSVCLLEPVDLASAELPEKTEARPFREIDGIYLDDAGMTLQAEEGVVIKRRTNVAEAPLAVRGEFFLRGVGMKAPGTLRVPLEGKYTRFQGRVGVDQGMAPYDQTRLRFAVIVDGKKRWESEVMSRYDPAVPVDVDLSGAQTLELVVEDPVQGYELNPVYHTNYGNWCDARLMR